MATQTPLKILLIQVRDNEQVRREEFESFVNFSGLRENQLQVLNVFEQPEFSAQTVDDFDAVLVGGASEASVLEPENYPFVPYCVTLLKYCVKVSKPVFASCFGFQLAVLAMDGQIVRDDKDFEIGTLPINLTDAAHRDPIFADITNPFLAVSVHRERAPELPAHCQLLAYTPQCPHAFRVENKPFWAFQFHPELDRETLVLRLGIFKEKYTENAEQFSQVIKTAQETPESNRLVRRFIEYLSQPPV